MSKAGLRSTVNKALRSLSQDELERQSSTICESLAPLLAGYGSVACYMSMDSCEVKTGQILEQLFDAGKEVYLPRCTSTRETGQVVLREGVNSHPQLTFHRMVSLQQVQQLQPSGKYQLREPVKETPAPLPPTLDAILVPGVAFSLGNGARMGHGAGFYDDYIHRSLHYNKARPLLVGLALKEQIVGHIPMEPHDFPMDCIVAGDGTVRWFNR